jgi:hypothetical protein
MVQQATPRREFELSYKQGIIARIRAGESLTKLSRETGIARQVLCRWRDADKAGKPIRTKPGPAPRQETTIVETQAERIAQLERLVGQLAAENRFFKGALQRIKEIRQSETAAGEKGSLRRSGAKPSSRAN